ncbi:MAG: cyclic nucleotide-binding domain-containing protein [Verrucomicrobia bacterium]|nr:cyclic nucleotide-binding domain-containing protein [Verrucomicrobiota bacterium]
MSETGSLPASGFIANLSQQDRDALCSQGSFQDVQPGTEVIEQGQSHGKLFFNVSGRLKAVFRDGNREIELGRIGKGEWFGEVDIFDPSGAICSVVAVEPTRYWVISREQLDRFIQNHLLTGNLLLVGFASTLGKRIREVMLRYATNATRPTSPIVFISGAIAVFCVIVMLWTLARH